MNVQSHPRTLLDLRQIEASKRQAAVFELFAGMLPGDELLLTHAHHSTPLRYLLLAEAPLGFTWEYLEDGPEVWRILICKTAARGDDGDDGDDGVWRLH
jgi:uncharacterized protein (DUF2249 family)